MPAEIIGEAGTPGARREWINVASEIAIKHLKRVCGEHPPEMELEIQWQEHDLGTIGDRARLGRRDAWRALGIHRKVRVGFD